MLLNFWLHNIKLIKMIRNGLTNSIGWNLGRKYRSIHLFEPLTSTPIIGTKIKNIKVQEKKISLDNIKDCKEAFITSASSFVTPVIQVDNIKINSGKVGEFSNLLRKTYLELND